MSMPNLPLPVKHTQAFLLRNQSPQQSAAVSVRRLQLLPQRYSRSLRQRQDQRQDQQMYGHGDEDGWHVDYADDCADYGCGDYVAAAAAVDDVGQQQQQERQQRMRRTTDGC